MNMKELCRYAPTLAYKIHKENLEENHSENWTRINLGNIHILNLNVS